MKHTHTQKNKPQAKETAIPSQYLSVHSPYPQLTSQCWVEQMLGTSARKMMILAQYQVETNGLRERERERERERKERPMRKRSGGAQH